MSKKGEKTGLEIKYTKEVIPALKKELKLKNAMAVPKVTKVTLNVGIGSYTKSQNKDFSHIVASVQAISGQKAVITKARMSVSNFKIRQGEPVGITVTLRGARMYHFLDKLINVVFPRVRDFRGISPKSFDGTGNYNIGFKEHVVFPEINPDDILRVHGLEISITTSAKNNEEGLALLKALGFPFKSQPK